MHASFPVAFTEILEPRTLLAANPTSLFRPKPLNSGPTLDVTLGIWHTYAQATADLQSFAASYPNLARLISLGKTVQNRDIWALEISDNVGVDEDEPEFMYQGAIHGDEPIGMENSFYLINDLLTGYGSNTRYTNLVNNMDLWFVPNMNWDGYVASSPSVGHRGNANNVDLNRNFPEWTTRSFSSYTRYFGPFGNMYDGPAPQTALLQPETVVMMNFMRQHNFVASATFHSGDLVVNYPWDTDSSSGATYAVAPDDALFKQMALAYSTTNAPMYNNNSFPFVHGTTNGDYWYPISGGLQDWANLYTGNHNFTIELNDVAKYPSATQLPTFWNNNKESMLGYLETANWGVRGLVRDSNTNAPLFAKVTLTAPAPSPTPDPNHPASIAVYTDPDVGDYHRQLLPGTYTMKFEAAGYVTQTISGIQITGNTNDPTATLRMNVNMVAIDNTPPAVTGGAFNFSAAPQSIQFTFSEPVQNLDNSDLILSNNTLGATLPSSDITLAGYDATTRTATFTFNTPGNTLPGASYTARISTTGVQDLAGNNLAGGYAHNFIYAPGTSGNDTFHVVNGNASLAVWVNADPQTESATYTAVFTSLKQLAIDGGAGNDTLTLDFAGGEVRPAGATGFGYRLGIEDETLRLTNAGAMTFASDPATETPNLTLVLENGAIATFDAIATHLAALQISSASSAILAAGSSRRLVVDDLSIGGSSTLNLNDNDLIVYDDSALPAVQALINTARAAGAWTGPGITSLSAKNNALHNTTLAALSSDDYESIYGENAPFAGEQLTRSAVLVKYTYYGDADFNGQVNFDDYSRIDNGFTNARSGWLNGDFDGNGVVNFDDYSLIDLAFNTQATAL